MASAEPYDTGVPVLTEIWVDPVNGNDARTGASRAQSLRTVNAAWERIPQGVALNTTGYQLNLTAGDHTAAPGWWDQRYGTYACPIIIRAIDGDLTARLPGMDVHDCRYLYLIGVHLRAAGGDGLHFASCRNILVRRVKVEGLGNIWNYEGPQEAMKINQSQYVYVENSDISGGWDNAVDFVAVQYGHVIGSKIHRGLDWCMYVKGGSSYFTIEGNEFYDGGTGGFTAGQGTGFEFMVSPWIHYEAENIKFINNIIHHTGTAGVGVNGGYNILIAYNTFYKAGTNDHVIEVVQGSRSCDGNITACQSNNAVGGWGSVTASGQFIPCRNVYIYNNVILNPPGFGSRWQHCTIAGPVTPPAGCNVPSPAYADSNLVIRGNFIWNDPADLPLGIDGTVRLTESQLRADNTINVAQPQLIDPEHGDFRPVPGGNVFGTAAYPIPDFAGNDRPAPPLAPLGDLVNRVARDYDGTPRSGASPPGAYTILNPPPTVQITAPANGVWVRRPTNVVISASAGDPDGIRALRVFIDNQLRGSWGAGAGSFTWTNPPQGLHAVTAYAEDMRGAGAWSTTVYLRVMGVARSAVLDFNRDLHSDYAVYWPATGGWYVALSGTNLSRIERWGWAGAQPVAADYDGDRRADPAVYDSDSGAWYLKLGGMRMTQRVVWGGGVLQPVPADYDGDGAADMAVYDPAGRWYVRTLPREVLTYGMAWGFSGALPVPADYDGDRRADVAVFAPAGGTWYIRTLNGAILAWNLNWGFPGCVPVTGDYDGDGRADLALFHAPTGRWYIRTLQGAVLAWGLAWGFPGCEAVPGDYDGDGRSDLALYYQPRGEWYVYSLSRGLIDFRVTWGWRDAEPVVSHGGR